MSVPPDMDLEQLVQYAKEGLVVPVLGQNLALYQDGQNSQPLIPCLVNRLSADLKLPPPEAGANSLADIVDRYVGPRRKAADVYSRTKFILDKSGLKPATELLKLASIRQFRIYVTLGFDSLLVQAINATRFGGENRCKVLAYSLENAADLPADFNQTTDVFVYHLFGQLSSTQEFAITDEDFLEWTHSLQSEVRQPGRLVDELGRRHLIVLGARLSNWLAPFLLRVTKRLRMADRQQPDFIAEDANQDIGLFLQRFNGATKFVPKSAGEIIDLLQTSCADAPSATEEWRKHDAPVGAPFVFISYAREDQAAALSIKNKLMEGKILAWMDDELRSGDAWRRVIQNKINEAILFIAVISKTTRTPRARQFREEWDQAILQARKWSKALHYLIPIAIDGTPETEEFIPDEFRGSHWRRVPNGSIDDAFVGELRGYFREYQKELAASR